MKAKILSLLLVVALLVTVSAFTAEAAVQLPAECSIDYSTDTLELVDGKDTCPACKTSVAWEPLPVNTNTSLKRLAAGGHYYLDPNTDYSVNTSSYSGPDVAGKTAEDPQWNNKGIAYSIRRILERMDELFNTATMSDKNRKSLGNFYKKWETDISGWTLPNIKQYLSNA